MMVVTRQGAGRAAANKRGAAGRLAAGLAGIAVAGLLASTLALAQDSYPSKPIRLLVSDTPGSAPDVLARKVAPEVAARMGQPWVVENRPGNRAAVVIQGLMSAPPDGSVFMIAPHSITTVWPRARRAPAAWRPMKLVPPRTRIRITFLLLLGLPLFLN